jgi:hypothetical protein
MSNQYPSLKLPLRENESPGDYMERYLLQLSARLDRQVTFSEVARHLEIPVNTVLAHKGGRPPESFKTMYLYATFFGPEILKAYGINLRQLAYILRQAEDDVEVQAVLGEMAAEARQRKDGNGGPTNSLARQIT